MGQFDPIIQRTTEKLYEDERLCLRLAYAEALSARLTRQFKIRAGRDRAWLDGIDESGKWRDKLIAVVKAMANPKGL